MDEPDLPTEAPKFKWRRQGVADRVDPWSTSRTDPINEVTGWGVDGFEDHEQLRIDLYSWKRDNPKSEHPVEWKLGHIAPWIPPERRSYWDPAKAPVSPFMARRMQETAARKEAFLRLAATGLRVRDILDDDEVGIKQHTYARWRRDDPDWALRLDRVRAGVAGDDLTFHEHDLATRRRYFFGYDTFPHQQLILDAITHTPPGGITLILLPPEAGKTSLLEDVISLLIADDPSKRILYVSEKAGDGSMGQRVLSTIKSRFTDPHYVDPNAPNCRIPEFIARYGPFRDDVEDKDRPWNQNYIKVHKAPAQRDFTFQVAGWRSRIWGNRTDILVFDDVQSSESLSMTGKMLHQIRQTFLTRPGKEGITIFLGNRVGIGDLYEAMIDEGMIDELVIIPALDDEGHSYWPERWPTEALEQRRKKVGDDIWHRTYMMTPQLAEEATYTPELLQSCHVNVACGHDAINTLPDARVVCGLDPALGGGNALLVAAFNAEHFRIVDLQVDYRLARNEDIFLRVQEMARYRFTHLVVEINSQQKGLARDDRLRDLAQEMGFEIVEHQTTASTKWDPSWGVRSMAGSFIRREVQIPQGDEATVKRLEPLVDQLIQWRPDVSPKLQRQDAVMALWFAWLYWQRERETFTDITSQWQGKGTPWKPGDMSGRWGQRRRLQPALARGY